MSIKTQPPLAVRIALIILFILMGNLFLFSFKAGERYIYFWDIAGYWTSSLEFTDLVFSDLGAAARRLYESVLYDDYTLLPVLAYIPVFRWLSRGNLAFVLTTYNVYGVPFLLMTYAFLVKKCRLTGLPERTIVLFFLFTYTVFLTPLMGGFLDACGLTAAAGVLLLLAHWDIKRFHPLKCVALAALILVLCFLRRWYSFWAVTLFPAYFIALAVQGGRQGLRDHTTFVAFANLFLSGALWLLTLFLFFRPFLTRVLSSQYSFAYAAYDFGGLGYNLRFFVGQNGWLIVILAAAGLAYSLYRRSTRFESLFLLLQSVFCLALFTRIQSLGVQHLYLFVPALCFFVVCAVRALPVLARFAPINRQKPLRAAVCVLLTVLIGLNFIHSYLPEGTAFLQGISFVFSEKTLYKRTRGDIDEIQALITRINAATETKTRYTYVLSSSERLNSDILKNAALPDIRYATAGLLHTFDVDQRDGFPDAFYMADFVVVTDPVQYHLDPAQQRIVGVLAEAILSGKAGDTLKKIAAFSLDGGVTAYLYEKQKPYTHDFLRTVDTAMRAAYPAHPFIHETLSIFSYMYDMNLPKGKNIYTKGKYALGIELDTAPTGFQLNLEGAFQKLTMTVTTTNPGAKSIVLRDETGAVLSTDRLNPGETTVSVNATGLDAVSIAFTTDQEATEAQEAIYADITFQLS